MPHSLLSEFSPFFLGLLLKYKYLILFPILVFEGPVITIVSGALATPQAGVFHIVPLFFFVIFADLCGDTGYYLIGRYAGAKALDRISKRKGVDYKKKIKRYFDKYGRRTLAIGKISHGLGWPVMVFAGSIRMDYKKFMTVNFIVSAFKTAVLLAAGYYYSEHYKQIISYIGSTSTIVTTIAIIAAVIYFYTKKED